MLPPLGRRGVPPLLPSLAPRGKGPLLPSFLRGGMSARLFSAFPRREGKSYPGHNGVRGSPPGHGSFPSAGKGFPPGRECTPTCVRLWSDTHMCLLAFRAGGWTDGSRARTGTQGAAGRIRGKVPEARSERDPKGPRVQGKGPGYRALRILRTSGPKVPES